MATTEARSLDQADETRTPDKTKVDIVRLGDNEVGRFTFAPGWRWSDCIKPVVGTDSGELSHLGYSSGRLHVVGDDGTESDVGPGDAYAIDPGHDAWVVGDEPFVGIEFKSAGEYARG